MERRKFIIGAGALATGSSAAMGTGAMSSMTADRSATIDVATDGNALLQLDPGSSDRVDLSEGQLSIDLDGVNVNSVYQVGSVKYSNLSNELSGDETVEEVAPQPNFGTSPSSQPAFYVRNGDDVPMDVTIEYEFNTPKSVDGSKVILCSRLDENQGEGPIDGGGAAERSMTADADNPAASMSYNGGPDGDGLLGTGSQFGVSLLIDTREGDKSEDLTGTLTITATEVDT